MGNRRRTPEGARRKNAAAGHVIVLVAMTGLVGCAATHSDSLGPSDLPSSLSNDSLMEAREIALTDLAAVLGIGEQPEIPLVRFVSSAEWPMAQIDCLNEAGFQARLTPDGSGVDLSSIPPAQAAKGSPLFVAQYKCEAQYSIDPNTTALLTDSQLSALYDFYVADSVPCLQQQGIDVPEPPSRQKFIETYFTSDGWYPYAVVDAASMTNDEWTQINQLCPQAPQVSALHAG